MVSSMARQMHYGYGEGNRRGGKVRNTEFEIMVRSLHGNRYSFELDQEGFYAREVTRRMYDIYCKCKGWI